MKKNKKSSQSLKKTGFHSRTSEHAQSGSASNTNHPQRKKPSSTTLYVQAAEALQRYLDRKGSLKSICFHENVVEKHKRVMMAMLVLAAKWRFVIFACHDILQREKSDFAVSKNDSSKRRRVSSYESIKDACISIDPRRDALHLILIAEALFGSSPYFTNAQNESSRVKELISTARSVLLMRDHYMRALQQLMDASSADSAEQLLPSTLRGSLSRKHPRYARVNTLLTKSSAVKKQLMADGYQFVEQLPKIYKDDASASDIDGRSSMLVALDEYVPLLFVFPPASPIVQHALVQKRHLILQDKSSCFPALALQATPGSVVIDGCAAPGNKTNMVACMLQNRGTLYAVERDRYRADLLRQSIVACNALCCDVLNTDFLSLAHSDSRFSNAKFILLDPSCSGSGSPNIDQLLGSNFGSINNDSSELADLAQSQIKLLKHALSFPNVERVSYSTCSVYPAENEDVIAAVLDFAKSCGFHLATALPKWHRRGLPEYPFASRVVRCDALDHTGGFFVAVFNRSPLVPNGSEI